MLEAVETVPVSRPPTTRVMMDHLVGQCGQESLDRASAVFHRTKPIRLTFGQSCDLQVFPLGGVKP